MSYSPRLDRLLYQYRHSPNIQALLRALLAEYQVFGEVSDDLRSRLDIALSEGVQLDGIGEIVDRPRPRTVQIAAEDAFALSGGPGSGLSSLAEPTQGGRFVGIDGLLVGDMPDEEYRTLLRATIFANYARSTIDNLAQYGDFVIGEEVNVVAAVGWADLSSPRPLQSWEIKIIRQTFPVAAGVRLGDITYGNDPAPFGCERDARNTGFGALDGTAVWEDNDIWDDDDFWNESALGDPPHRGGFVALV